MAKTLRPIPKRLLPDQILVYPSDGNGGYEQTKLLKHVRVDYTSAETSASVYGNTDSVHTETPSVLVFVDAVNTDGAFEIPVDSKIYVRSGATFHVRKVTRCCVFHGQVHHWEIEAG